MKLSESGNGGKTGRGASGGKMVDDWTENGNGGGGCLRNENDRCGNRNVNGGAIHLAMREHCDRALMFGLPGVGMEPFVQRRRRRQGIQQENNAHQQGGNGPLAAAIEMALP